MRTIFKISEAAVIALHAVDLMGREPGELHSATGMAGELGVSYNHLSKILQRLTKAGFVSPLRGPRGGFALAGKTRNATLKELIEAIEGPMTFSECMMGNKICGRKNCSFNRLLTDTNRRFEKILAQKVSAFAKNR